MKNKSAEKNEKVSLSGIRTYNAWVEAGMDNVMTWLKSVNFVWPEKLGLIHAAWIEYAP